MPEPIARRSAVPRALRLAAVLVAAAATLTGCSTGGSAPVPTRTYAVTTEKDVVFAQPDGVQLRLDACTPKGASGPLPAVVIVHSGSFTEGSHSDLDWLCAEGAARGFAAFTVDYRLLPAAFPAQLQDVASAVDWISADAQAKRYDVDPKRIVLLGTSAGATVVAELLTGVPGSPVKPSRFKGGALLSAAVDATSVAQEPGITPGELQVTLQYAGCTSTDCSRLDDISAVKHVSAGDPPMFVANSTDELVPVDQAKAMAAALQSAGVRHELRIVDGQDHAEFIAQNHPDVDAAMWAFLRSTVS
jgi:acetyl esterase